MPPFLTALIIVVGGYWFIKKSSKLSKSQMAGFGQKVAGGVVMAFAALLMVRGEINVAIGLFVFGMGLYGKSAFFPNGFNPKTTATGGPEDSRAPPPLRPRGGMTSDEALQVLGLKADASLQDIKLAHKRLIKDFHPDKGGSDYLAAKINEAKDILLR